MVLLVYYSKVCIKLTVRCKIFVIESPSQITVPGGQEFLQMKFHEGGSVTLTSQNFYQK